ncbi:MAG: hypothetical protein FWE74_05350 [Oscillospiraceae bacterium]|nr:hypothetical protein [Oscillospiraceae bacterium]
MKQIMYCDKINCRNHRNTCHGHDYKISGELYKNVCAESMYFRIANPTAEQFKLLEKFVLARIEYIKCPL